MNTALDRVRLGARLQVPWAVAVGALWVGGMWILRLDRDYTSGELLDHVLSWRETGVLYPALQFAPPFRVLNYPPLFAELVRGAGLFGLSPLAAGRLLGTAGILLALGIIYRWLRNDGLERALAAGVVACAATSGAMVYSAGQMHLEGLASAATLAGFFCLRRRTPRYDALAGVLLAIACLTKQTQVVLSIVALAWAFRDRPRAAARTIVTFVVTGALGCVAITGMFGVEAWRHMVPYTVGTYSLSQFGQQTASYALPWIVFAVIAYREVVREPGWTRDLRAWYLFGSTPMLLASARVGASYQYFLDWQFAVLLWVGVALQGWLAESGAGGAANETRWRRFVPLALVAQLAIADVATAGRLVEHWRETRSWSVSLPLLCPAMPMSPVLTVAEYPGLVRACGGRPAVHPFIMASLASRKLWDETIFVSDLARGSYAAVVLPFDPADGASGAHAERWTPAMISAMATAYRGVWVDHWWVGRPRALTGRD